MSDDTILLRRYAEERSETAFTELVRRHLDLVYGAALRRCGGDPQNAEEVAQLVFTALARQAHSLTRHTVLTAWLYATTRNIAVDRIRAEYSRHTREQEAHVMHQILISAPAPVDWERLRAVLDDALDELSEADRTAVLLRFFQQRPFAEIGDTLRLSDDAARMRVERALDKLHLLLTRRGIASTTTALTAALANDAIGAAPAGLVASVAKSALRAAAAASSPVAKLITSLKTLTFPKAIAAFGLVAACALSAAVWLTRRDHAAANVQRPAAANPFVALPAPTAGATPITTPAETSGLKQLERTLSIDPQLRQLLLDRSRLNIRVNYAAWFRRQRWTPAQVEAFADFVFDYARQLPAQPNYQPEPDMVADPAFAATVRARFGDAVAESFAQCQRTIVERRIVESIFGSLTAANPLTPGQVERLIEILADAHPPMGKLVPQSWAERAATRSVADPLAGRRAYSQHLEAIDWAQVLARAESVIAPSQLVLLRALEAKARAAIQLRHAGDQERSPEAIIASEEASLAAYCRELRAGLDLDFARARIVVGLTEQQVEDLKDIKIRAQRRAMEVRTAAETSVIGPDAARAQERAAAEEQAKREAEVLGDRTERFREFYGTMATRKNYVERLAACELHGASPLNTEQVERVIQVLAAHSRRQPNGGIASAAVDWAAAGGELGAVIAPEQITLLQQFAQMSLLNQQVDAAIDRAIAQTAALSTK